MELSNYKIGQVLGSGSFGEVRLAVEKSSGRKVAIKAMSKGSVQDISEVERVSREFYILTALDHKNVIRLYEVLQSETHLYLVMEYAGGGSLDSWLTKAGGKAPDERSARKMFTQILSAVRYCHRKRIIHRDLKPENILLTSANAIKVADFGLSNTVSYGGRARSPVGTPLYAAPEVLFPQMYPELDAMFSGSKASEEVPSTGRHSSLQSIPSTPQLPDPMAAMAQLPSTSPIEEGGERAGEGAGALDDGVATSDPTLPAGMPRLSKGQYTPGCADVWSLGVILHRLVFGCLPYEAASIRELKNLIFNTTWHPPSTCSPALLSLLKGMLERDPLQRMSAEAVSAHAWTEAGGRGSLPSLQLEEIAARAREEHSDEVAGATVGESGQEGPNSGRGGGGTTGTGDAASVTTTPAVQPASSLPASGGQPGGTPADHVPGAGALSGEGQFQLPVLEVHGSGGSGGSGHTTATPRPRAGTGGAPLPPIGMPPVPESPTAAAAAAAGGRQTPKASAALSANVGGTAGTGTGGSGHGGSGGGPATALPVGSPAGGMFPLFVSAPLPGSEGAAGAPALTSAAATPAGHLVRARRASISQPTPIVPESASSTGVDTAVPASRPGSASGGPLGDDAELLPATGSAAGHSSTHTHTGGAGGRQGGAVSTDSTAPSAHPSPATQQAHIPTAAGSAIQFLRYGTSSGAGGGAGGPGRLGSTITPTRRGSLLGATPLSVTTPVQGLGAVLANKTGGGGGAAAGGGAKGAGGGGGLKRDASGDLAHAASVAAGPSEGISTTLAAAIGPVRDASFLRKATISSNASLFAAEVGVGAHATALPALTGAHAGAGEHHHLASPTGPAVHAAPLASPSLPDPALPRAPLPPAQLAAAARQAIASLHPIQPNAAAAGAPKLGDGPGVAQPRRASLVGKLAPILAAAASGAAGVSPGQAASAGGGGAGEGTAHNALTKALTAGTQAKAVAAVPRTMSQPLLSSASPTSSTHTTHAGAATMSHTPAIAEKTGSVSAAGGASPAHAMAGAGEVAHAPVMSNVQPSVTNALVHAAGSAAALVHARRTSLTSGGPQSVSLGVVRQQGGTTATAGTTLPALSVHAAHAAGGPKTVHVQGKAPAR